MTCPFCDPDPQRVFYEDTHIRCLWDGFPVSQGHALVIPRRHVSSWFDASPEEKTGLIDGIEHARAEIERQYAPGGYNIGINVGQAAGQTVPHLHVHLIPRYPGDVPDPRGGVRYVIPDKGNYLEGVRDAGIPIGTVDPVLGSETKPLLPALVSELTEAVQIDLAVAFVTEAGLGQIEAHLIDLFDRNGRMRLLTGDYLDVTEPRALRRLLDLTEEYPAGAQVRVFETNADLGFHPKAYLVHHRSTASTAFVGSSNLTRHALARGLEWNQRLQGNPRTPPISDVVAEFERLFLHPRSRTLTAHWIEGYSARRSRKPVPTAPSGVDPDEEPTPAAPDPHDVQAEALSSLAETRATGNRAGLVVMATGLGKTWLAAFDSEGFERVLFVAHREEILNQAMRTFRRIRPDADLGLYAGGQHDHDAGVLFASVQTLSRVQHLRQFDPRDFDYIVVDEFHHAAAATYRRLIDHFDPTFLLGLTATPERTDGGDLLALCGENLVFRCDLHDGIQRSLLSPFQYFGVPDVVEFENIPWRNGRFDPEALDHAVATHARASNAFEQWTRRGQTRTLAFCVSQRHAVFMTRFFQERGVACAAVHSGRDSAPRTPSLQELVDGKLQVVFAVDMFNEGVDVPSVDTILMLRPTESKILWLQQFGRGLRRTPEKSHLAVIDYIGNHRTFLQVPMLLLPGAGTRPGELSMALERLEHKDLQLPPGCSVEYELEALNLLKQLARPPAVADQVAGWYRSHRELHSRRPFASEAYHEGYDPRRMRQAFGSWLAFVNAEGDLDQSERTAFQQHRTFLEALETTPMNRSFKIIVLLGMLVEGRFPGAIGIDDLGRRVTQIASRSTLLRQDFGAAMDDPAAMRRLLETNPIYAWCGGRGMGGTAYFKYGSDRFETIGLAADSPESLQALTRELCDWRLAQYLDRLQGEATFAQRIVCKVSHSGGRPILFLPSRDSNPGIPSGWTPVSVEGVGYQAKFVKVAVNVLQPVGSEENALPEVLRGFFGDNAGSPGTHNQVMFEFVDGGYILRPLEDEMAGASLWREYMRAAIPPLWGLEFSAAKWNQGFVVQGQNVFLLVSLAKGGMASEHQYEDKFLSKDTFQWVSQNRTKRDSRSGRLLHDHAERGVAIHLFVREQRKTPSGTAAPFVYCGELDFLDWEGDQPISVRWKLRQQLPEYLSSRFMDPGTETS